MDANVASFSALYAITKDSHQTKSKSTFSPCFKFGIEIPRSVHHALELDKKNGNASWADAIQAEMTQINEHTTFIQAGGGDIDLNEYTLIRYHIIFDVKFDLYRKARLVANGNGTEPSLEDVYSGVVAQDTIRIVFLPLLLLMDYWYALAMLEMPFYMHLRMKRYTSLQAQS